MPWQRAVRGAACKGLSERGAGGIGACLRSIARPDNLKRGAAWKGGAERDAAWGRGAVGTAGAERDAAWMVAVKGRPGDHMAVGHGIAWWRCN